MRLKGRNCVKNVDCTECSPLNCEGFYYDFFITIFHVKAKFKSFGDA